MFRPNRTWIVALALAALVLLAVAPSVSADCPGTPLLNAGFEDGFSERGAGEVSVANGWNPFWQNGPFQEDGQNLRPEFKPEDASRFGRRRVLSGSYSQKWFNTFGSHHAGIYQQAGVPQGSVVTFSAWGQAWSSEGDNPDEIKDGWYAISVGIDPTGGTDWTSANVVWSEASRVLNAWAQVSVQAQAQGGAVTVYIRGDAEFRTKHNDAYVDDACLTYVAPTPAPTSTPRPTDVPTITPTPMNTATPEPSPTPEATTTPEPAATPAATVAPEPGAIRVVTFEDTNGNGARDAGEPLVTRAGIEVRDAAGRPVEATIAGATGEPVTLTLAPGEYRVAQVPPGGYVLSSPEEVDVTVNAGETTEVAFGLRFRPTATPEATVAPSRTPTPTVEAARPVPTPTPIPAVAGRLRDISGILVAAGAVAILLIMNALRRRS